MELAPFKVPHNRISVVSCWTTNTSLIRSFDDKSVYIDVEYVCSEGEQPKIDFFGVKSNRIWMNEWATRKKNQQRRGQRKLGNWKAEHFKCQSSV